MLLGYLNTRPRTTYMAGIRNPNMALVSQARLERMKNPFKHEEAEEGGGSEHEHSAGEKQAMGNVFNPDKSASDAGYRLSLAVLEPTHS
jgi:hypothetical protein